MMFKIKDQKKFQERIKNYTMYKMFLTDEEIDNTSPLTISIVLFSLIGIIILCSCFL